LQNRGFDFSVLHALDALIVAAAGDPIPITALGHEPQNVRSDLKHGYKRLAQQQARPSKPHAGFKGKMSVEQQEIFFVRRTFEGNFEKLADAGVAAIRADDVFTDEDAFLARLHVSEPCDCMRLIAAAAAAAAAAAGRR